MADTTIRDYPEKTLYDAQECKYWRRIYEIEIRLKESCGLLPESCLSNASHLIEQTKKHLYEGEYIDCHKLIKEVCMLWNTKENY